MERRALALKEMVEKRCPKKETLDPRKWVRQETMKGFVDFVLNRDSDDTDSSFDSKEMLLYTEKQFMEAAKRNDVEAMKVLGKGLNANAKNVDNRTALHYAVAGKNKEAVQFLLQRRVRVDQKDKHGVAPIHLAAWFGSLEILKLLVQAGAEQKVKNEEGLNILHCAAINNHTDILEYIVNDLQMKELDKDDLSGNRPFALAAEHGCAEMLDMLMVPYEMATMKPNKDGETALYQAADKGQERCVRALLEAGCDPNILTTAKCSALHSVSEKGDTSLVQLLLEYKAHTDFKNQYQEAPLHLAVKNSHIPVIHSLLKAGCDSNITNKRSQTAMHLAAELGKIEVVEMLLKAGLDLTLCDQQGKTALGVAARADEVIIVDMIIKAERYYAWRTANPELNDSLHNEYPLTFKLDHRHETKQLRSMAWRLAYELLKPGDWKRLAEHWGFNKEQVSAIEEQWTGQHSYKEHGNRMLLIWLHGEVFAQRSPAKKIYQDLILTGNRKAADKIWMEEENASSKICSIS
ncbi:ankyrin repeat and death domain-containing protein 1B isoform X2 [Acanthopagrus latus]|uniref:ankyrin repeat and death domain-containing protein 1B isoform X2 n=1 Tax=Acanthopagrus latus TaxID=8177 RepID=UPI00187BE613|nr:ankyrin repeat and death domain-containing protein 1B isoform X2 [Acanthopagrus latus]